MISIEDLGPWLEKAVDIVIDDGPLEGRPSTIIDHTTSEVTRR